MNYISAKAPGKCILFGEHSVVYGYPAIAMGISLYSDCYIEVLKYDKIGINLENYNENLEFSDLDELIKEFPSQFKQIGYCLKRFKDSYKIDLKNTKITLSSSLFPSSGLGSSASIAVALVSAMNSFFNIQLNKQQISHFALDMEKLIHGTPSGIDNTICTFGSMIFYEQGAFRFIEIPNDLIILVTYTNIEHDTGIAIQKVRDFTKKNPNLSDEILNEMGSIAKLAEFELLNSNLKKLGSLMNKNQEFLAQIGVSNEIISEIIEIAMNNGALGSKLTGAGLGGCVISIGPLSELETISELLKKKGYPSFITKIDREGVKVEST